MYQVGQVFIASDKQTYVYINQYGTVEKLPQMKWYAMLYLEILQGLNKFLPLTKIREFSKKYKKTCKK